jgi:hypothetical protein
MRQFVLVLLFQVLWLGAAAQPAVPSGHPSLLVGTAADRAVVQQRVRQEPWAAQAWQQLQQEIEPYVARHQQDPKWIVSRLAMYWKPGAHYTQCYLKKENWDYGTGNAPVPTVRLPGMRTWNEYVNVPLVDRIPYNETGDMLATSRKNPAAAPVRVPYKQSGHLVRGNNKEILELAEKASFAYWLTGEERYAKFAADILWPWMLGTYYMQPILDPGKSSGGPGGWAPGGILGYYDYEQIHDELGFTAAPAYDFLTDYLRQHPDAHLAATGKNSTELAGVVFKRFIDLGLVRGDKRGNWNVNGWNMMLRPILVLEPNRFYADGHGREYYLQFYTTTSTQYHEALPDMLRVYDPVTGLWPESPGYAFGTIGTLLDHALLLRHQGLDVVKGNPTFNRAALAMLPWLDARANTVVFGDDRGGPADFQVFERLLTYYTSLGDTARMRQVAAVLQKGISTGAYRRAKTSGWIGLCANAPLPEVAGVIVAPRTTYSAAHRHLVLRNGSDEAIGLMATLYGGYPHQRHLIANGLAMQLYGRGWALAPDASGYESYWSADYAYHQTATGSNTILPGYTDGPITLNAVEPAVPAGVFTADRGISPYCSFADVSAGEKRRLVSIIRTSPTTGYYVDIFRSNQPDNDYLYHNLGNTLQLSSATGQPLPLQPLDSLPRAYSPGYRYFTHPQQAAYAGDFRARWTVSAVSPPLVMDMWMQGQPNRQIVQVEAPYTSLKQGVTPGGVNVAPQGTPTLLVRQTNQNAWQAPFVAVFEPYEAAKKSVANITALGSTPNFAGLLVESLPLNAELTGRREYICQALDTTTHCPSKDLAFRGTFGVAAENAQGFQYLYLGVGQALQLKGYGLAASTPTAATLVREQGTLRYSARQPVEVTLPQPRTGSKSAYRAQRLYFYQDNHWQPAPGSADPRMQTVHGQVPAGTDVPLRIASPGAVPVDAPTASTAHP